MLIFRAVQRQRRVGQNRRRAALQVVGSIAVQVVGHDRSTFRRFYRTLSAYAAQPCRARLSFGCAVINRESMSIEPYITRRVAQQFFAVTADIYFAVGKARIPALDVHTRVAVVQDLHIRTGHLKTDA